MVTATEGMGSTILEVVMLVFGVVPATESSTTLYVLILPV